MSKRRLFIELEPKTPSNNLSFAEEEVKRYEQEGWVKLKRAWNGATFTLKKGKIRLHILPCLAEMSDEVKY